MIVGSGFAAGATLLAAGTARCSPAGPRTFRPEDFGARGDGVANDSVALSELAQAVTRNGGGVIEFRPVTYVVGMQRLVADPGSHYSFEPIPLLEIANCIAPIEIRGNGARLKCARGLRFGTFAASGSPTHHPSPNMNLHEMATPYIAMIFIRDCKGPVLIKDLELDGNLRRLIIGGPYLDGGWQIPATGLFLRDNRGDEIIQDVHTHHHALDGLMIDGLDDPELAARVDRRLERVRSEYNGRQGCSLVGGSSYKFFSCHFNHTGRAGIGSSPGAGVDIEAEGKKKNRNFSFANCEFVNNVGCGVLAETGDSADCIFSQCKFVGTTAWSAWPRKPYFRFEACTFVGSIVNCYGDSSADRPTQFHQCAFVDDPSLAPGGRVYRAGTANGTIADLSSAEGVRFEECRFEVLYGALLPWSAGAVYSNCSMRQTNSVAAYPRGTYLGSNKITGNVDLAGSRFLGHVSVNGKIIS